MKTRFKSMLKKNLLKSIIYFVAFTALLILIGRWSNNARKLTIQIGDIAKEDIRATKTLNNEAATEQLRRDAENSVVPKYRISPLVQMVAMDNLSIFMDSARDIKAQENLNDSQKSAHLEEVSNLNLDSHLYSIPISMEYRELSSFESLLRDLSTQIMGQGIREDELNYEKNNLNQVINGLDYRDDEKELAIAIMDELIQPNEFIDEEETQRRIDSAVDDVVPVVINPNEVIVREGEVINSATYELIVQSGLVEGENTAFPWYLGFIFIIILGMLLFAIYIFNFNSSILKDNRLLVTLLILSITIIISLIFNKISPFLMPISLSTILIAMLIDVKLAIFTNFILVGFLWLLLGLDVFLVSVFIIPPNLAILIDLKSNQRYSILVTGFIVGLLNVIVLGSFQLLDPNDIVEFLKIAGLSLLNGVIAGIIVLGTLPVWENVFFILTPLKLLELTNPNQPLLHRMLFEAPGTYHHSIMVSNLSEAAANEIGANSLLAKAGGIYHDIGKVNKPYYFKENQFDIQNPHDLLEPLESARIITGHTDAGKKLAMSKRLPREIFDMIEEHHGDTYVQYFYHEAKKNDKNVDMDDFRYKGRKPRSKEAAIVMLADSSEAAVRSIKNPTKEKIAEMVTKVVKGKLNDGQLEDCQITYRDIQNITKTFIATLIAISHDRIEYPEVTQEREA